MHRPAAAALRSGDRFEIRFNFSHTGSTAGFDAQILWGTTGILLRHGSTLDAAVVGRSEASVSPAGAQITTESWGTILPLLPGIVSAPPLSGLRLDFLGKLDAIGTDSLGVSYTILRYPAI